MKGKLLDLSLSNKTLVIIVERQFWTVKQLPTTVAFLRLWQQNAKTDQETQLGHAETFSATLTWKGI